LQGLEHVLIYIFKYCLNRFRREPNFVLKRLSKLCRLLDAHEHEHEFSLHNGSLVDVQVIFCSD
jgi:hypothetical protein